MALLLQSSPRTVVVDRAGNRDFLHVGKTPFGQGQNERVISIQSGNCIMVQNTREKRHFLQKYQTKKNERGYRQQYLANCGWLPGRMHIEERLNEGPRFHESILSRTTDSNMCQAPKQKEVYTRKYTNSAICRVLYNARRDSLYL